MTLAQAALYSKRRGSKNLKRHVWTTTDGKQFQANDDDFDKVRKEAREHNESLVDKPKPETEDKS